jgi:hypothetical protein
MSRLQDAFALHDIARQADEAGQVERGRLILAGARALEAAAVADATAMRGYDPPPEGHRDPASIFVNWSDFWQTDHAETDWLFEPILARGRGHAIFASRKTGKSLVTLWMAATLATGGEPVRVVYLDYEMTGADLDERLTDMGYGPATDLSRLRYALLPSLPPLDTPDGGAALLHIVAAEQAAHPRDDLAVIIDTTSRAVTGDENSADTIRAFYRWTGLGLKQRGVTWARLDHAGKDATRGQRGSSAKDDDVDIIWRLDKAEDGYALIREAARMGWVPEKTALRRHDDPLRFTAQLLFWPEGTKALADLLDKLGLPAEATRQVARKALTDAGQTASTTVLAAAVKYRKGSG